MALLVCFSLSLFSACGGYRGIREPQLTAYNSRWERRLTRTARTDLACREVRLIPLSDSVIQADGCSRVAEYGLFCLGSRDCNWRAFEGVAAHASRDLACHEAALSISAVSATQRNVFGCGRTASYTLACAPQHCAWTSMSVSPSVAPIEVVAVTPGATDDIAIPPPPGSTSDAPPPGPASATDAVVIPPPPGSTPPPPISGAPTSGGSTDEIVIPPPPS
jgi:hypothetical protein